MTRTRALAPRGQRAKAKVPRNRGQVLTVLGAMRASGETTFATIDCGTSGDVFEAFCRQILLPFLRPGDILIWDNLAAHKKKEVAEMMKEAGVHIHFQPPYTPEANAIELLWAWLKNRLRGSEPRTRELLEAQMIEAAEELPSKHAMAWTRHCGYMGH